VKDPQAACLEASILRDLHARDVAVPGVLACEGNLLVLEYLPGEPLPDIIERGNYSPATLASALCDWFAAFYAAVPESRGDVNGRNFLCDGEKIYSVDFEERCFESPAKDAGRLAAFIETYNTSDTLKQIALAEAIMCAFVESFDCDMSEILSEKEAEYDAMRLRRHHRPQP